MDIHQPLKYFAVELVYFNKAKILAFFTQIAVGPTQSWGLSTRGNCVKMDKIGHIGAFSGHA
jgi:hypothetical protein